MAGNDWNFADEPNVGALVMRDVYEGRKDLTCVTHDLDDGCWQFLDDGDDDEEAERDIDDAMLVHLGHIVERFPEIAELADLPLGWIATRDREGDPWVREPRPSYWKTD
jgi:hypothetical protein